MGITKAKTEKRNKQSQSNISVRSFAVVAVILLALLFFCGSLSYFIPQGTFETDADNNIIPGTYVQGKVEGIAFWRVLSAPVRVFASEDAITIIMISVFLLIMNGVFNLLEKTGGIRVFIVYIMRHLRERSKQIICITVLVFMLFGSLFGMFEELVTLLPLIIVFMLSMKMDTMMGLGTCLMAACFGFSAAITNPFSVGTAAQLAQIHVSSGAWLRVIFFVIVYLLLCAFLLGYLKKIRRDPSLSPTYETDKKKQENLLQQTEKITEDQQRVFRIYVGFFAFQGTLLVAIACIRAISGLAIPILAASFLITGLIASQLACKDFRCVLKWFLQGAVSMLPAVAMIAIASSVKLVMVESNIIATVMQTVLQLLEGKNRFIAILLIYGLILFLQLFIGSASAKIFLVMPIILPVAEALGISPTLVILTYCMADGFTDVILPTNPVLLIGLSMADVSYWKWLKWTWKLQALLLAVSVLVLLFGMLVGY